MDRLWKKSGIERKEDALLIRYPDDMILLSSRPVEKVKSFIDAMFSILNLQISEENTRITTTSEGFDFLGIHFFMKFVHSVGKECIPVRLPKSSMKSVKSKINDKANRAMNVDIEETAKSMNLLLHGW